MGKKGTTNSGLGNALARRKERSAKGSRSALNTSAAQQAAATGRHTVNQDGRATLQSVLDATDLEELMLNATLANEDFVAERYPGPLAPQTVVVTPLTSANMKPAERNVRRELDKNILRIPRRPPWNSSTTYEELMVQETDEFLKWRRKIATTEEENSLASTIGGPMMTPFEKNLEVWRQLWRVVERSDAVIQIVDARNPLLYYCEDLYRYVTMEMRRAHILVVNKSDLLSSEMIDKWERYFKKQGVDVVFFSAFKASVNEKGEDIRVMDTFDLIERLERCERVVPQTHENQRIVIGMCGYPNVGKSSTINVLLETVANLANEETALSNESKDALEAKNDDDEGSEVVRENATDEGSTAGETQKQGENKHIKRVAVSSTPGKTKHFQTLILNEKVLLCDCPGLVFPNFSTSKAELICAGVLSIDTMRGDYLSAVSLIAERIPASTFEGVYGIRFPVISDGVLQDRDASLHAKKGYVSGTLLMDTHARARGYMSDHDKPDQSRSARVLLKNYVNGQIIYAHGPPGEEGESGIGPEVFARKGKLVYERKEANERAERQAQKTGLPIGHRNGSVAGKVNAGEGLGGADVRARVSGRKKHAHKEFVRIERNYYPEEWRS